MTHEGRQALARPAMLYIDRNQDETLMGPSEFFEWLALIVTTCATGQPEPVPLPNQET